MEEANKPLKWIAACRFDGDSMQLLRDNNVSIFLYTKQSHMRREASICRVLISLSVYGQPLVIGILSQSHTVEKFENLTRSLHISCMKRLMG